MPKTSASAKASETARDLTIESDYIMVSTHACPKPCNSWVVKPFSREGKLWVECDNQNPSFKRLLNNDYRMLYHLQNERTNKCEEMMIEKAIELARKDDPDIERAPKRAKREMVDHIGGHPVRLEDPICTEAQCLITTHHVTPPSPDRRSQTSYSRLNRTVDLVETTVAPPSPSPPPWWWCGAGHNGCQANRRHAVHHYHRTSK
jgi:hypothetical protein